MSTSFGCEPYIPIMITYLHRFCYAISNNNNNKDKLKNQNRYDNQAVKIQFLFLFFMTCKKLFFCQKNDVASALLCLFFVENISFHFHFNFIINYILVHDHTTHILISCKKSWHEIFNKHTHAVMIKISKSICYNTVGKKRENM